jgi:hypothetical protein
MNSLEENQRLLRKVQAARRLERVMDLYDGDLSSAAKEHIRAALDLLNGDFRHALGRTMVPKPRRQPKAVPPAESKEAS